MKKLTIGIAGSFRYDATTRDAFDTYVSRHCADGTALEFLVPLQEWSHCKLAERLACMTYILRDITVIPIVCHRQLDSMTAPDEQDGRFNTLLRRLIYDIAPRNKFIKIPQATKDIDGYILNVMRTKCDYVIFGEGPAPDVRRMDANDIFVDAYNRKCESCKLVRLSKIDMGDSVSLEPEVRLQTGVAYVNAHRGRVMSGDLPEDLAGKWAEDVQDERLVAILERAESLYDVFRTSDAEAGCSMLGLKIFAYAYLYGCNWAVAPGVTGGREVWTALFRQWAVIISALAEAPEEYYTNPVDIFDFKSYDEIFYIFR